MRRFWHEHRQRRMGRDRLGIRADRRAGRGRDYRRRQPASAPMSARFSRPSPARFDFDPAASGVGLPRSTPGRCDGGVSAPPSLLLAGAPHARAQRRWGTTGIALKSRRSGGCRASGRTAFAMAGCSQPRLAGNAPTATATAPAPTAGSGKRHATQVAVPIYRPDARLARSRPGAEFG